MSELLQILQNLNQENLNLLDDYHPYDIAETLSEDENQPLILQLASVLTPEQFGEIFIYLPDELYQEVINDLGIDYTAKMLETLEIDDAVDVLKQLDYPKKYLPFMNKEKAKEISVILSYDEDDVGSIMNTSYLAVDLRLSAKEATKKVMQEAKYHEFINVIFVLDEGKYYGFINLKELIVARANVAIKDLVDTSIDPIQVEDNKEDAAHLFQNYDVEALAIVDEKGLMLGIITYDDVLDVTIDAAVEDYAAFAGVITDNIEHDNETIFSGFKKRIVWLVILLFANLFTSTITGAYENKVASSMVAILTIFMPLILGMAGNVGTQSLAVTIRLLGTEEIASFKEKMRHLGKELKVGLVNGLIIALAMFLICMLILVTKGQPSALSYAISTAISVFVIVIAATLSGVLVPIIMDAFKIDPAVASGPFITTINDIIALVTYFTIAQVLIQQVF